MSSVELIFKSFASVLAVTDVLGNTLVILVILKNRKTPINYLLLNLAVADLMVGIFAVPWLILLKTFTHPRGLSGDVLCKIITMGSLAMISAFSSVLSLVFIAFERYYAIMKPLSIQHRITTRKLKILIPISWIMAAIRVAPYLYFGKFDEKQQICRYVWPTWYNKLHFSLHFLVVGILPTSIMAVLYSRVIHRLWFKRNGANNATLQAVRQSRKKITKTMLTLSVIYVFCWGPDALLHFSKDVLTVYVSFPDPMHKAFLLLILINSTVNPIVYAFQFEEFRKGLRKIICCEGRRTRIHVIPRNSQHKVAKSRRVDLGMN